MQHIDDTLEIIIVPNELYPEDIYFTKLTQPTFNYIFQENGFVCSVKSLYFLLIINNNNIEAVFYLFEIQRMYGTFTSHICFLVKKTVCGWRNFKQVRKVSIVC